MNIALVGSAEGSSVHWLQGQEQESRTASPQWKVPPVAAPPSLLSTSQSFTATQRPVPASTIEVVPFTMSTAQIWLLSPARQVSSDSGDHDRAVAHGTAAAAAAVAAHSPRIAPMGGPRVVLSPLAPAGAFVVKILAAVMAHAQPLRGGTQRWAWPRSSGGFTLSRAPCRRPRAACTHPRQGLPLWRPRQPQPWRGSSPHPPSPTPRP